MKRRVVVIAWCVPFLMQAQAPVVHRAVPFDAAAVALDDMRREADGELHLYARSLALGTGSAEAEWSTEGEERVARLAVSSPGALAMELLMEDVRVPEGAQFRVLSDQGEELHPPVTIELPADVHEWTTPLVAGDRWVLEYREPLDAAPRGSFRVPFVGHAYREVEAFDAREGDCHVNVECTPESNGWEGPIRATVRISVVTPQGSGWCTGTLVNNVRQDCAPYILTAWHCGRTSSAAHFNQYKFYFNFQYATCAGGAYSTSQFMTGAQLKAYSNDYDPQFQGLGGSDFMLLRTNVAVPSAFEPYWSGWDATAISTVSADGVCIHHPTGAPKRISSYTQTLTTGHPMTSSGLMTHYKLKWAQTQNGFGVTESGSSGSGVFKPNTAVGPLLIGTLTGSSSGMTCTNNTGTSYFGKMSYHWTNNPNTAAIKLRPWLDPDNTGTLVLGGGESPCTSGLGMIDGAVRTSIEPYPNPAQDVLHVPGVSQARWTIMDATGRILDRGRITTPGASITLVDLPNGHYVLQLRTPQEALIRAPFVVAR